MTEKLAKFKALGLNEEILKIIQTLNFNEPSEIQEKSIPPALAGKDVIGSSATGSGKTLAFGYPLLEGVSEKEGIQALVLTPTRELAEQVSKSLRFFGKYKNIKITSIYGGISIEPQIRNLQDSEIVVGTPGRILDHLERRTIDLSRIRFLVLDEADRMLDMGFLPDVKRIMNKCNKDRQTLLFSATISDEIDEIIRKYMKNPIKVSVQNSVDPSKLKQVYYDVQDNQKFSLLIHLLKEEKSNLVMVFSNTKRNADFISDHLKEQGLDAMAFHGNLSQNSRNRVLERFHKSQKFVLVCTDVAARGLDIKNISHIYNYDCPKTSTDYIHRIGRTARAGKDGKAITILGSKDYDNFRNVIRNPSLNIERIDTPEFEMIFIRNKRPERKFGRGRETTRGRFRRDHSERSSREGPRNRNFRTSDRGPYRQRSEDSRNESRRGDSRSSSRGRSFRRSRR
jgi:ATP-dependent RNA helicase DeaD